MQFIDARDVGAWTVDLCEQRRTGTFNATRPGVPWAEMLDTCQRVVGGEARIVWLPDEFLRQHEVGEWMELPSLDCRSPMARDARGRCFSGGRPPV